MSVSFYSSISNESSNPNLFSDATGQKNLEADKLTGFFEEPQEIGPLAEPEQEAAQLESQPPAKINLESFGKPEFDISKLQEAVATTAAETTPAAAGTITDSYPDGSPKAISASLPDGSQKTTFYSQANGTEPSRVESDITIAPDGKSSLAHLYDPKTGTVKEQQYVENGKLKTNTFYDGDVTTERNYDIDGNLAFQVATNKADDTSVLSEFYPSGNVAIEHHKKYGIEHGTTTYYDSPTPLKAQHIEKNYPSQGLTTTTSYDSMNQPTASKATHENGQTALQTWYENGKPKSEIAYGPDGMKTAEGYYDANGIKDYSVNFEVKQGRYVPKTVDYYNEKGDWATQYEYGVAAPEDRNNPKPPPYKQKQ